MFRLRVFALLSAGLLACTGCVFTAPDVGKLDVSKASYLVLSTPHRGPRDTLNLLKVTNIMSLNAEGRVLGSKALSGFAYAAHDYRDGVTLIGSTRKPYAVKITQDGSYKMIRLDFSDYKIKGACFWNVKIIEDGLYAGTINGAIQSEKDVVTRLVIFNDAGEILSFHETQGFFAGLADADGGVYWVGRESKKDDLMRFTPDNPFVVFKWDSVSRRLSEVARIAPGDNKSTIGWYSSDGGSIIRGIGLRRLTEGETEKGARNGSVGESQMIIDELDVKKATRRGVDIPYSPDTIINTPSGTIVFGLGNPRNDDMGRRMAYRYDENMQVTGKVVLSEEMKHCGVMSVSLVGDEIIGILGTTNLGKPKHGRYWHDAEIFHLNHKTMKLTRSIVLNSPQELVSGRGTLIPITKNLNQQ